MGGAAACCAPAAFRSRPGPPRRRGRLANASAAGSDAESFRRIVRHPRTAEGSDGTLLYFGYGANLAKSALRQRGVSPSASAVARAPGYELVFAHRGGYATIDPDPSSTGEGCWGVVHRISRTELAVIRKWETGYETKELEVEVARDSLRDVGDDDTLHKKRLSETPSRVRALAFVSKPSARLRRAVVPFDAYAKKLARGAKEVGLPEKTVAALEAVADSAVSRAKRGAEHFDVPSFPERLAWKVKETLGERFRDEHDE
jgi:cation transport regulator ChaC